MLSGKKIFRKILENFLSIFHQTVKNFFFVQNGLIRRENNFGGRAKVRGGGGSVNPSLGKKLFLFDRKSKNKAIVFLELFRKKK